MCLFFITDLLIFLSPDAGRITLETPYAKSSIFVELLVFSGIKIPGYDMDHSYGIFRKEP
jgi:hypothetical protein